MKIVLSNDLLFSANSAWRTKEFYMWTFTSDLTHYVDIEVLFIDRKNE